MSILSPTDRAVLWRTVMTSGSEDRGSLLRVLAREILDSVGRRLDLYAGHEEEFIETVELLDASGLMGRDDLREAFEEADEDDEHAQAFVALRAGHLSAAADLERLGAEARLRAARLASVWQGHVLDRPRQDAQWLSAAQVAARYSVTPQAVYKWIKAGRVEAEQTPGGSWRLPAEQFERGRTEARRLAALKAKLLTSISGARRAGRTPTYRCQLREPGVDALILRAAQSQVMSPERLQRKLERSDLRRRVRCRDGAHKHLRFLKHRLELARSSSATAPDHPCLPPARARRSTPCWLSRCGSP